MRADFERAFSNFKTVQTVSYVWSSDDVMTHFCLLGPTGCYPPFKKFAVCTTAWLWRSNNLRSMLSFTVVSVLNTITLWNQNTEYMWLDLQKGSYTCNQFSTLKICNSTCVWPTALKFGSSTLQSFCTYIAYSQIKLCAFKVA